MVSSNHSLSIRQQQLSVKPTPPLLLAAFLLPGFPPDRSIMATTPLSSPASSARHNNNNNNNPFPFPRLTRKFGAIHFIRPTSTPTSMTNLTALDNHMQPSPSQQPSMPDSVIFSSEKPATATSGDQTHHHRPSKPDEHHAHKRQPKRPLVRDLDICVCHATADFDSLAAAVGLARLRGPGTKIVIPAGEHDAVHRYLSLHRGLFPIIDTKAVDPSRLRWVGVVDTHSRKRVGPAAEFLDAAEHVEIIDHHSGALERCDIDGDLHFEPVGAASTIIVERLQAREANSEITITPAEATLLALAIHTDTGNLCWETTTPRDAAALAWCLSQGACQRSISQFARNYLTPEQQRLLSLAIDNMIVESKDGVSIATVVLEHDNFVKGMASAVQATMELSNVDVLLFAMVTPTGRKAKHMAHMRTALRQQVHTSTNSTDVECATVSKQVSLIGRARSQVEGVDFGSLFLPLGGGGHPKAASASIKVNSTSEVHSMMHSLVQGVMAQLPEPVLVKDFMSKNVACVYEQDSMATARDLLFHLGHTGMPVVMSSEGQHPRLVGVVSRQDIAMAERRDLLDTPVKGWAARKPIYATEETPLHEAEAMLADNKIGRLPVLRDGRVVGIVTRSDILIQRRLLSR